MHLFQWYYEFLFLGAEMNTQNFAFFTLIFIMFISMSNAQTPTPPPTSTTEVGVDLGPSSHDSHHSPHSSSGVSPEKSWGWLKNGNIRFIKARLRADGQSQADVKRLKDGQTPHAIILSCSDSRVPPEVVFDQKLGEVFVVRTAGEALDSSAIASIEYAVSHLGSRLIVVMGHTSCGAVKAALATLKGQDAGSPALNKLVADLHPRLQSYKEMEPSNGVEKESWSNTRGVAKDLAERSQIIAEKVKTGDLVIKVALYYLDSGAVIWE